MAENGSSKVGAILGGAGATGATGVATALGKGASGLGTALGGGTIGIPGMGEPGIGAGPGAGPPRAKPSRAFRSAMSLPGPGFFGCSKAVSPCVRDELLPGSLRGEEDMIEDWAYLSRPEVN
jgi:hypothetical protein